VQTPWWRLAYAGRMTRETEEHIALVALLRTLAKGERWATVTERVLERGSARAVWQEKTSDALVPDPSLAAEFDQATLDVNAWITAGRQMVGILDDLYPTRLREIHQAPPFLFAAGTLLSEDPAIAVVGSRRATPRSLDIAGSIASALASEGITVLSGLAAGIDAAAHTAALEAGGRTVAIIGTGIAQQYPAVNRALQLEIEQRGLVLSQFWPEAPPQKHNFLMRNAVMSGYGRATVVVEAGEQSGARAQARMAVEHGRPVVLTDQVVAANEWAKKLLGRPGVLVARGMNEVMDHVRRALDRERKVGRLLDDLVGAGL